MGTHWRGRSARSAWKFAGACWRKNHGYEFIGAVVYRGKVYAVVFCPDCPRLFKLPLRGGR
jgi:hypothetical protein